MNEFDYGDPHPLAINLRMRKHEADQRAGRRFVEVLSTADTLYLQDVRRMSALVAPFAGTTSSAKRIGNNGSGEMPNLRAINRRPAARPGGPYKWS